MNRAHLWIVVMMLGLGVSTGAAFWKTKYEVEKLKPIKVEQTITTSWPDGGATDAISTPHGQKEPAMDWLSRHFETVEFARNYKR